MLLFLATLSAAFSGEPDAESDEARAAEGPWTPGVRIVDVTHDDHGVDDPAGSEPSEGGGCAQGDCKLALVLSVKELQRRRPTGRYDWLTFCKEHGESRYDPARHDVPFLQQFFGELEAGRAASEWLPHASGGGSADGVRRTGRRAAAPPTTSSPQAPSGRGVSGDARARGGVGACIGCVRDARHL